LEKRVIALKSKSGGKQKAEDAGPSTSPAPPAKKGKAKEAAKSKEKGKKAWAKAFG